MSNLSSFCYGIYLRIGRLSSTRKALNGMAALAEEDFPIRLHRTRLNLSFGHAYGIQLFTAEGFERFLRNSEIYHMVECLSVLKRR